MNQWQALGHPEPEYDNDRSRKSFEIRLPLAKEQVTGEVTRLLAVMSGDMRRLDIQAALKLKHEDHFRAAYLIPAMDGGFIEMTIPDKPKSRLQKYRLTDKGKELVEQNQAEK